MPYAAQLGSRYPHGVRKRSLRSHIHAPLLLRGRTPALSPGKLYFTASQLHELGWSSTWLLLAYAPNLRTTHLSFNNTCCGLE